MIPFAFEGVLKTSWKKWHQKIDYFGAGNLKMHAEVFLNTYFSHALFEVVHATQKLCFTA